MRTDWLSRNSVNAAIPHRITSVTDISESVLPIMKWDVHASTIWSEKALTSASVGTGPTIISWTEQPWHTVTGSKSSHALARTTDET